MGILKEIPTSTFSNKWQLSGGQCYKNLSLSTNRNSTITRRLESTLSHLKKTLKMLNICLVPAFEQLFVSVLDLDIWAKRCINELIFKEEMNRETSWWLKIGEELSAESFVWDHLYSFVLGNEPLHRKLFSAPGKKKKRKISLG